MEDTHPIEQKVAADTLAHDKASASIPPLNVRHYDVKVTRQLASGEFKEYTIKSSYVLKKKPGISKTEMRKREAALRKEIQGYFHNFEISQLKYLLEIVEKLNSNMPQEYYDQRGSTERAWYMPPLN